jgi:hypothetical protein
MKDCEAACLGLARFFPHLNSSCLLLSIWTLPDCVFQCFCSLIHMTKGILAMDHHLCELPIFDFDLKADMRCKIKDMPQVQEKQRASPDC